MKTLAVTAAVFVVMTMLGFTTYYHDQNPWGGWFVPLWFASLAVALLTLSAIAIIRGVSEIASGEVTIRMQERRAREARRLT